MPASTGVAEDSPSSAVDAPHGPVPFAGPILAAGCMVVSAAAVWLAVGPGERSLHGLMTDNVLNNAINGLTLGALAGVLTQLRPHNRLGWLILLIAWGNALAVFGEGWALASFHLDLPGRALFAWLGSWPWAPALLVGPAMVALLYPSGRTTSRLAHRLAMTSMSAAVTVGVCLMLLDGAYDSVAPGHHLGVNPISRAISSCPSRCSPECAPPLAWWSRCCRGATRCAGCGGRRVPSGSSSPGSSPWSRPCWSWRP